jgi:nucleoside-diphosphate-sugar epimerase
LGGTETRLTLDVVTGAFSYTGRHIEETLLARGRRVRTLTRRPAPSHPLAENVEARPFVFDDSLVESLAGVDTLYNTDWCAVSEARRPSPRQSTTRQRSLQRLERPACGGSST